MARFPLVVAGVTWFAAAAVSCSESDSAPALTSASGGVSGNGGNSSTAGVAGMITGLQPSTWTWVPFPEAHCRDGSSTGIGISANPASDKLMILLAGGGACFDAATCAVNPRAFSETDFVSLVDDYPSGNFGIFDREDATNPVKDWSFVFVPYCTGDVHAGNNPQGSISGAGAQEFVGYVNLGLYLQRIAPTFPGVVQVLLTGVSAGGFGALANYDQVKRYFGSVPVVMLDDSGPPMAAPYLPACLGQRFQTEWGLDRTVLVDCGSDCPDGAHYLLDYTQHLVKSYPSAPFALIESMADYVMSWFFGFGANDCTGYAALSEATFTAGLEDIRAQLAGYSNFGTYLFPGSEHTTLLDAASFDTRVAANTRLTDYIAELLAGRVSNVGP